MEFTEPTDEDITRLAHQVLAVGKRATQLGLPDPVGSEQDLTVLQAMLDSGAIDGEDTYLLQSMGVVLGKVLVSVEDGLDWSIVHDEYGSDPTLRYRNTRLCVNVLTTISKRVEDGEEVEIRELFQGLREILHRTMPDSGGTA